MSGAAEARPMRQLLVTADTLGGVWDYAFELSRELCARGLRVTLATLGAPLTAARWQEVERVVGLSVLESHFRLEWMDDPWRDVDAAGRWLLEVAEAVSPDVVHLNQFSFGALPWDCPTLVVGHSCVRSWFTAVRGGPPPRAFDRYHRAVARGLRCADAVVAPTETMLRALRQHYGALPEARVVPNGRTAPPFMPLAKERFILGAGRLWDEAKNLGALDRVAPQLPWPVYLAGAQSLDRADLPLRNAYALGWLEPDALAGWMGRASIYALPARYEPFGLSALEAALSGCALVLGDIPSLREVWADAALYVAPDDDAQLTEVLGALCMDEARRATLATAAYQRAQRYSAAAMVDGYLALYRHLVHKPLGALHPPAPSPTRTPLP